MKSAEMRAMTEEQLTLTRKDTIKHLFQLRFQSATDRLETPSEIRKAKRDVARINTVVRQRELERLAKLSAEQLQARLAEIDGAITGAAVPGDVRKLRRDAARLRGLLRGRQAAKGPAAAPQVKK